MKILLVHNYYRQPGGEDCVFHQERDLLLDNGHQVVEYTRRNDEIDCYSALQKLLLAARTTWAFDSTAQLAALIRRERPAIAHFHNTFPLISPAAYYACRREGVPVIQTLHNPRLLCPAATLYRNGASCELCVGKLFPWPGVIHGCYRDSAALTATVGGMLAFHRIVKTWQRQVSVFIASTPFFRSKFIEGGLPAAKILVKPHFVGVDPGARAGPGSYAVFVGRLTPEKGVATLLRAWRVLPDAPLRIRGDGLLLPDAQRLASECPSVQIVPRLADDDLLRLIREARFLVWPSEGLYETFGLIAIQAFACGVPVIASRSGVMQSIVSDGRTGVLFNPGDAASLAEKVRWALDHTEEMDRMGRNARLEYEANYTPARNFELLNEIYRRATSGVGGDAGILPASECAVVNSRKS